MPAPGAAFHVGIAFAWFTSPFGLGPFAGVGVDPMTHPAPIHAPALESVIGGGYVLQNVLGVGGMGVVYEATAPTGERVAIKVVLPEEDASTIPEGTLQRFEREWRMPGLIQNPHIVPTLHAGFDAKLGVGFYVMPLLIGLDLRHFVRKLGPFHPVLAARIIRQICVGLEHAHRKGIVHRDLKPANIFFEWDSERKARARILDFGVAKDLSSPASLTHSRTILGSPGYMAPEQVRAAKDVDSKADIWSLGVILYELLVGTRPFSSGPNAATIFVAVCMGEIPHIQDAAPWLEPGLAETVHGCLIRDRELRCPTVGELARALLPYTQGSDELEDGAFVGPDAALLAHQAERTALPRSWQSLQGPAAMVDSVATTLVMAAPDPWLGAVVGDGYTLLHRLGTGGMGTVYEALGPDDNRYAIKLLELKHQGERLRARERLQREAQAAMRIRSPHVVQVYETCTDESSPVPFIVMELLRGYDLSDRIERKGALQPAVAARLFTQACLGLAAAHGTGFLHRDVKPSNLFLQLLPSGHVTVKLCDLGLVKVVGAEELAGADGALTYSSQLLGTPQYISPEQAKGGVELDVRADLWGLGMSLFHALAGEHAWPEYESAGQLIVAVCTEPIPRLDAVAPWVPSGLADVVEKALQRAPEARFPSAEAFAAALEPFCEGQQDVHLEDLAAVPGAARPAGQAGHDAVTRDLVGGSSPRTADLRASNRSRVAAVLVAALLGLGALLAWQFSDSDGPLRLEDGSGPASAAVDPVPTPSAEPSTAPSRHEVSVDIVPASARVAVDGKERLIDDGVLKLSGEPGDTFDVELRSGRTSKRATVVITKQGTAKPDRIEARAAGSPRKAATARPGSRPPRGTPDQSKQWADSWQ